MLGRDESVDTKISTSLLTALYFLNTLPGTEICEAAYGDILADVARIRAIIQGVHGASPGLRMVEKTDYYGWLMMFMLANAVTKAFSEMSDKSWLESNLLLDSALRVCQRTYHYIFTDVTIFINGGELGGATTASWHAHLLETLNEPNINSLPLSGDDHLITQSDFARLRRRRLDGQAVQDFIGDIAAENFLHLGASLPKSDVPRRHAPFINRISHLAQELASPDVDSDFIKILPKLSQRDIRNPSGPGFISVLDFLRANDSDYLYRGPAHQPDMRVKAGVITLNERKRLFCQHVATYKKKISFWEKHKNTVSLSPVTEILSGALLRQLRLQGLANDIDAVLHHSRSIPDDAVINVDIVSNIRSFAGNHIVPGICFTSDPRIWSLYGKDVFAVAEQMLNTWWGKLFEIANDYVTVAALSNPPVNEMINLLHRLNTLLGLTDYLIDLRWRNIPFERVPGALNYAAARHSTADDITETADNYLQYFVACFARSARHSKNSGLHKPTLCPRSTIIRLSQQDGREIRQTIIRPMLAYKPLMSVAAFNTLLGPVELMAEANARLEIVETGQTRWVVQKMGGEDVLFLRDKRKQHYSLSYKRQQGERDFISGINDTMKTEMMNERNLGPIDDLYKLYYIREHCANSGNDFRTVYNELSNNSSILVHEYAEKEMEKVYRRHQDKQHGFLHYRRIEILLKTLRTNQEFNLLLDAAGLSGSKILRDHITQIFAFRELERATSLKRQCDQIDSATEEARATLLQDNLDTIVFFRLSEIMVNHAFADVILARQTTQHSNPNIVSAIARDTRNGAFLLIDTIARLLYRCVVSHEWRDKLHDAIHLGNFDHVFFPRMVDYVIKGLTYNGYKTKEFWQLGGAMKTDGYIELLSENQVPKDLLDDIAKQRYNHVDPVAAVSLQLGRWLMK
ncbi:MAG: hypothetical protein WCK65_12150 [Rhodospirillaceae bacterium]